MTLIQVVYGRSLPPLIYYRNRETPNSTFDEELKERDVMLGALKEHLIVAQEKMKKCADLKRSHVRDSGERNGFPKDLSI